MKPLDINTNYSETYKNAILTIVAEDGLYTTALVEIGKDVECFELCDENHPDGYPFNPSVRKKVMGELKAIVDKKFEELVDSISVAR